MNLKSKFIRLQPEERLYQLPVPVIGLTGGIASGKSTVGRMLNTQGLPLVNADHLVKDIYASSEALRFIEDHHPEVIQSGSINFPLLREKVFNNPEVKAEIEKFIYQRLPAAFQNAVAKFDHPKVILYDVPLLFEKNLEKYFDLTVLVYAPRKVQKARLIVRDGHQEPLADKILEQQMDIEDKKLRTDFVIDNSRTEAELVEEVKSFLHQIIDHS